MSRGQCGDNAAMEGFFVLHKRERIDLPPVFSATLI